MPSTAARSAIRRTRRAAQRFDYVVAWGVVAGSAQDNKFVNFELGEVQEYSRHADPATALARRDELENEILPRINYPDGYALVFVVPHGQKHASVVREDEAAV